MIWKSCTVVMHSAKHGNGTKETFCLQILFAGICIALTLQFPLWKWLCIAMEICVQGRVVRKPLSANPGLKVNQSINFSSIKMYFTPYDLCGSSLVKLRAEEQTVETENLIEKLQCSNQNSRWSWVSLIGLWTTRPWPICSGYDIHANHSLFTRLF